MPVSPSILLLGKDFELLETRRLLLESVGFHVFIATHVLAANKIIEDGGVELLILCHSLSEEERERARSMAHAHSPELKVLTLEATLWSEHPEEKDRVVSTAEGPWKLVKSVKQLVERRIPPEPSRKKASEKANSKASA